jgi:hypothetical protein
MKLSDLDHDFSTLSLADSNRMFMYNRYIRVTAVFQEPFLSHLTYCQRCSKQNLNRETLLFWYRVGCWIGRNEDSPESPAVAVPVVPAPFISKHIQQIRTKSNTI